MLKIISANRLADGIVVYLGQNGAWFERLNQARIFTAKDEADAELKAALEDVKRNLIVEPCVVDVADNAGALHPSTLRESIRAQGPTIDFLQPKRAIAHQAVLAHEKTGMQSAHPGYWRAVGPKDRGTEPVADFANEIAQ